jgi:hypothetical protein
MRHEGREGRGGGGGGGKRCERVGKGGREERGKAKKIYKKTSDRTQSFELLASVCELYKYVHKGVERQIAWVLDYW